MGADLWIESIAFKSVAHLIIDPHWARWAFDQCRRAINEMDQSSLTAISERQPGSYADLDQYKHVLRSDLAEVEAAVFDASREAAKSMAAAASSCWSSAGCPVATRQPSCSSRCPVSPRPG